MSPNTKFVTELDYERLLVLLEALSAPAAKALEDNIAKYELIRGRDVPENLITMNSVFQGLLTHLDSTVEDSKVFTLVYPQGADIDTGRLSILSPLGAAILGARVGDEVSWRGHDGAHRRFFIKQMVYQPEASGDWHL